MEAIAADLALLILEEAGVMNTRVEAEIERLKEDL
jgi:hypothetical protein